MRWVSRRLAPLTILQIGVVLIGLGLGSYSFAAALPALVVGILVNAFGRMLAEPMIQTITAQVAVERARAAYFGFGLLALGIGGSTGQLVGGWLFDLGQTFDQPTLPWIGCGLVAFSVVLGLGILRLAAAGRRVARAA